MFLVLLIILAIILLGVGIYWSLENNEFYLIPLIKSLLLFAIAFFVYKAKVDKREYQIVLEEKYTLIYDGDRLVGKLPYDTSQAFDRLLLKDNY